MPHPIQPPNLTRLIGLFVACPILSGYALMRHPDSCDQDSLCRPDDQETEPAVALTLRESRKATIFACRPWNTGGVTIKKANI